MSWTNETAGVLTPGAGGCAPSNAPNEPNTTIGTTEARPRDIDAPSVFDRRHRNRVACAVAIAVCSRPTGRRRADAGRGGLRPEQRAERAEYHDRDHRGEAARHRRSLRFRSAAS